MSSSENQSVPIASCQGACSTTQRTTNPHQRCRDTEGFQPYGSHGVRGTTRTETSSAKPEPGTKPTLACHTTCGLGPDLHHHSPAACQGSTRSGSVPVCVPAAMVSARLLAASGHSPLPTRSREHRLFQNPSAPLRNPIAKHRPGLGHMVSPAANLTPASSTWAALGSGSEEAILLCAQGAASFWALQHRCGHSRESSRGLLRWLRDWRIFCMTGRELGLLALERRLRGSLINVYRYPMGGKENRQTSRGSSAQGQDERQWAQIGRFEIPSEHMKTVFCCC